MRNNQWIEMEDEDTFTPRRHHESAKNPPWVAIQVSGVADFVQFAIDMRSAAAWERFATLVQDEIKALRAHCAAAGTESAGSSLSEGTQQHGAAASRQEA